MTKTLEDLLPEIMEAIEEYNKRKGVKVTSISPIMAQFSSCTESVVASIEIVSKDKETK